MKVELVVDPTAPASFADRVGYVNSSNVQCDDLLISYFYSAPKQIQAARPTTNKPKPATKNSTTTVPPRGTKGKRGRGGRAGNPRGKKPTAEELDADMADYFVGGTSATTSAAPPTATTGATNGDVGMDDDVLVSLH